MSTPNISSRLFSIQSVRQPSEGFIDPIDTDLPDTDLIPDDMPGEGDE